MKEQRIKTGVESRNLWNQLEDFVRDHIQQFVQRLFIEEVTMRLAAQSRRDGPRWTPQQSTAMGTASRGS